MKSNCGAFVRRKPSPIQCMYSMPANGPYLILMTVAAIALLLTLIMALKLHAFLALLVSSMALGLAVGMPPDKVLISVLLVEPDCVVTGVWPPKADWLVGVPGIWVVVVALATAPLPNVTCCAWRVPDQSMTFCAVLRVLDASRRAVRG